MNALFLSPALAPPLFVKATLLLAEFCPDTTPDLPDDLPPQLLTRRANVITSVLNEIISQPGWRHGGIND